MQRRDFLKGTLLFTTLGIALAGCTAARQQDADANPFVAGDPDYIMCAVMDLSGSYHKLMTEDGLAYKAMVSMTRQFYKDRTGEDDKLLIAQISAVPIAPLWEGSPRAYGKSFPTGKDFRGFLERSTNPNGSRVFDSISDSVEYFLPLLNGKNRAFLAIFSDMDDNMSKPDGAERLIRVLSEFGRKNGSVGIYWCDLDKVGRWRAGLKQAGVRHFVVESSINADPKIPVFD